MLKNALRQSANVDGSDEVDTTLLRIAFENDKITSPATLNAACSDLLVERSLDDDQQNQQDLMRLLEISAQSRANVELDAIRGAGVATHRTSIQTIKNSANSHATLEQYQSANLAHLPWFLRQVMIKSCNAATVKSAKSKKTFADAGVAAAAYLAGMSKK